MRAGNAASGIVGAVQAGFDTLIHCMFRDPDGTYRFDGRLADQIAKAGLRVNPTLHGLRARIFQMEKQAQEAGLKGNEIETFQYLGYSLGFFRRYYEERLDNSRRLVEAGVSLVAGSDSGWGQYPVGRLADELEAMTMAGLTPMQAILSSTREAAEVAGISELLGSVEPGKQADLMVVSGDPSNDIMTLEKVEEVFQGGSPVLSGV